MSIDTAKSYTATFQTSRGNIVCKLFAKDAPKTVNNFVNLANDKFYDGLNFHRVIADFMIQGGCPEGSGRGGPGYRFEDEVRNRENQRHFPGVISMANAGPGTNGSQFFITHIVTDWLDGKHTVFGKVLKGQDIVNGTKQGDQLKSFSRYCGIWLAALSAETAACTFTSEDDSLACSEAMSTSVIAELAACRFSVWVEIELELADEEGLALLN